MICFAKTRLLGVWVCQVVYHSIAMAPIQFPAANQRHDKTIVSVGSKACNESKDRKKDILLFVL